MMSKKPSIPPRPPAPKVGGGGTMSFSFKALEEEDDEELTTLTGKFDKQVHDEREQMMREHERERSLSKSPDSKTFIHEHRDKSPALRSQKSIDKLIDFKGKIQETINKKIEEFSESQKGSKEKSNSCPAISELDTTGAAATEAIPESHSDLGDLDAEYFDSSEVNHVVNSDKPAGDELEINEEFFSPDGGDFSELPGVVSTLRQRKRFQKYRKIKPVIPAAPVSMSKLSKSSQEPEPVIEEKVEKTKEKENNKKAKPENDTSFTIHGTKVPVKTLTGCAIVLFLYMVLPLPAYIKGMVAGIILSSGGWMMYLWVTAPPRVREPLPEDPPLDQLPPLNVPEMREPKGEDGVYKGWMNEVMEYSLESYSINQTHSVHVYLEGTSLRLRRPKLNVPKRAMWDEPTQASQFIHQRHFDLEGSKVLLMPPGLVKKRLWSKKYPICILLAKDGKKHETKVSSSRGSSGSQTPGKMSTSSSLDSVNGFEVIFDQKCDNSILYLFARTCPEKEQWYRRLEAATKGAPLKNHILEVKRILSTSSSHRRSSSTDSLGKAKRQESSDSLSSLGNNSPVVEEKFLADSDLNNYVMFMSRLMPRDKDAGSLPASPAHQATQKEKGETKGANEVKSNITSVPRGIICDSSLLALNALLGRCFWDFLKDQYWAAKVQEKLQKKLSKIHIPYFLEELRISDISLGSEVPVIRRTNKPFMDENGFWMDLDVTYSGKFKMTIETKVNLLKLKHQPLEVKVQTTQKHDEKKSAVTDEEEEDSAESSTDEEEETEEDGNAQAGGTGKKLMKYINKITASKYFQSAAENKYIKKAMTEVSNTPLVLTVEMQKLTGTLALNIPPPPTDRLWYGFRGNPQLWLVAKPKVGEREVTMSHITDWIEKKLALEFQHVLVMPNMDDLIIPILLPGNEMDLNYTDESEV